MGKLRPGHLIEAGFWLSFAALAYYYSFEFDQPIEIYKFGASSWPRAIILLIALAALAQLWWQSRYGDEDLPEEIDIKPSEGAETATVHAESKQAYYFRIGGLFLLPLLYAYFMNDLGFYASTPFFIVGVMWLMGERRWKYLLGVMAAAYIVIVIIFAKFLYVGLPVGNISPFYDFSNWLLVLLRG